VLVGTLLAGGVGHEREPAKKEKRKNIEERERVRARQLRKCKYYRGYGGKQREERREKIRNEEESFVLPSPVPRDSAEIHARVVRPCDAVYYAFAQEGACIYVHIPSNDFVNPALDRSYYVINFNSHP